MLRSISFFAALVFFIAPAYAQTGNDPMATSGNADTQTCQDSTSLNCTPTQNDAPGNYAPDQAGAPGVNSQSQDAGQGQYDPRSNGSYANGSNAGAGGNGQLTAPSYRDANALPNQGQDRRNGVRTSQPEPLTEFQKFVAETTGQVLPIFGASLVQNVPTTFAPGDQIPVPQDALVGPGDLLRIRIWGQVNFSADLRVDRSGEIYLPQVGPVHVAGVPYGDLDKELRTAIARVYRNFNVAATLGQIRSIQIYVVGRARRPGTYTVSSLSSLVDAVFASGGPALDGSLRHIQLKRGGQLLADLDLYDLLVRGDKSHDQKLESGDVIYIPAVGSQIAVVGSVKTPAIYEELGTETIGQALDQAAGLTNVAGGTDLLLERMQGAEGRAAEKVALDPQGLAQPVRDGDILRAQPRVPQYARTVTLRGNTANPGRYAWHPGMHLSELLPERQALLTRTYWWQRGNLGLPAPEFLRSSDLDRMTQRATPEKLTPEEQEAERRSAEERYRADYLLRRQNNPASQERYDPINGPRPYELSDAEKRRTAGEPIQVARPLGQESVESDASTRRDVVTENTANARTPTRVTLPAPEIDWRYAVIERLDPETLKTSLIPFDLGKLVLDHDVSQDLELKQGDVVTIFSQADIHVPQAQQTRFVRLEGEFAHSGVYSILPGETLRDLVQRAGGFAPGAYLYGSEFTRVSVQAVQQRRLDDYIQKLQLQIERGILATASSASASAAEVVSANSAGAQARELVTRLQQIRATGRIVLNLHAYSTTSGDLPPLQLEDGDRFYVPSPPSNVSVIGAVYDQNSFLYRPNGRVYDYLHLAGGGNRDADKAHPYVIRADGSVLSQEQLGEAKFRKIVIQPGDTIVVSEKTFGPTKLRTILDFSQLFSQLAISGVVLGSVLP